MPKRKRKGLNLSYRKPSTYKKKRVRDDSEDTDSEISCDDTDTANESQNDSFEDIHSAEGFPNNVPDLNKTGTYDIEITVEDTYVTHMGEPTISNNVECISGSIQQESAPCMEDIAQLSVPNLENLNIDESNGEINGTFNFAGKEQSVQYDEAECPTDSKPDQNESNSKINKIQIIISWLENNGHDDLIDNWADAIEKDLLKAGNISFLLFNELLFYLTHPGKFQYSDNTLLWWLVGYKKYGARFLRDMNGLKEKINFVAPLPQTLKSFVPKAFNAVSVKRKAGGFKSFIFP